MSFIFDDYFSKLKNGEAVVAFHGAFTSDVINSVIADSEAFMDKVDEETKLRKKLINVLVETLQNLFHHNIALPEEVNNGVYPSNFVSIVINRVEGCKYQLITGNFVTSNKIKYLSEKIDKINTLTMDELKEMYKFILNHQKLSAKGGGGLGLIDIARKTGNKMKYNFFPLEGDFYFYSLEVLISVE